ncbi:MAG: hydrogenase maturation nickel metallochaperone HypA [Chitinophagaceae bacterium]
MHEISICQSIIKTIETELEEEQFQNIREIHVKIGVLSCVEPTVLTHIFTYIIEGTPFSKSSLYTNFVEVVAACEHCNKNFKVEDYKFICPECDTPSSTIIEGNELTIYKIILEESSYAEVNQ